MIRKSLNFTLAALFALFMAVGTAQATTIEKNASTVVTSAIDAVVFDLPLPRPSEIPDLVRRLGKMIGRALGLEFVVKVTACAVASENVFEFRQCLRKLLQMELGLSK